VNAQVLTAATGTPADATATPTPLRKDAARNRAAILTAARELFGGGRDVPMYEIGRRAGVGQATLYRHFSDRAAIVAAITREHVERIEANAAGNEGGDQAVVIVLQAGAEMLVCIHDLLGILRDDATLAPILDELRQRMLIVLEATLNRCRGSDLLRDDLDANDLMLVLKMVNGALVGVSTAPERTAAAGRALDIATNGLRKQPAALRPPRPPRRLTEAKRR
jgi:AcrR family transcriptional regulator